MGRDPGRAPSALGEEARLPAELGDQPGQQWRQHHRHQPGAAENDRQGQATVALEPQVDQLRPGNGDGSRANQRHGEERQVQPTDGMLDPGDRRIADHLQHDRHYRHPPQAETAVQRTDQLGRDRHAGEQEGDRRLQFTPAPAKSLFEGNHQGAEAVEQTRADTGADTDEAKQQDAPATLELGEVDGRPLGRNGCIGHMRTPISARRVSRAVRSGLNAP